MKKPALEGRFCLPRQVRLSGFGVEPAEGFNELVDDLAVSAGLEHQLAFDSGVLIFAFLRRGLRVQERQLLELESNRAAEQAQAQHIEKGKGVVSLGLTWSDELRLSLFSSPVALQLKKLAFLDTETAAEEGEDKNARIEGQLVLESGTYSKVIDQLVEAFGGLYTETA
jgi:hypothetical protein